MILKRFRGRGGHGYPKCLCGKSLWRLKKYGLRKKYPQESFAAESEGTKRSRKRVVTH